MIHDIILSVLDPSHDNLANCKSLCDQELFHPCEKLILKDILVCAELYQAIRDFIAKCSSKSFGIPLMDGGGVYSEALAQAMDSSMDPFRHRMLELEKEYIKNGQLPMNYFMMEIKEYQTLFKFMGQFIDEVKSKQLHGCAIISLLHKHSYHTDQKTMQALKNIRSGVYSVFLQQLSQWLVYGRLVDTYGEFFIVHVGSDQLKNNDIGMLTTMQSIDSEITSNRPELWQFQISYAMVPPHLSTVWAEKCLFIGQIVQMMNSNPNKSMGNAVTIWKEDEEMAENIGSLWNHQEHVYFNKIQTLHNCDAGSYEHVVNEIKQYVTERLSEIAFNQADLIKHLKLFRDYHLLGRGELFTEFIEQLSNIRSCGVKENLAREVNQAFQTALSRVSIETEHITTQLNSSNNANIDNLFDESKDFLSFIHLNFNIKWPLHLFFSPQVLEQYNRQFSFLLRIRQIQSDLHKVWRIHREKKILGNSMLSQLRNKMLFLIDNLQYYLQVDVLESHFSVLMNTVQNSKDFEFIKRAHNIFLVDVMSLSFLLNSGPNDSFISNTSTSAAAAHSENPVLVVLMKMFKTIKIFCVLNDTIDGSPQYQSQLEVLEDEFSQRIQELLNLLTNRKAGPSSEPLSQLLLRLDFNYWFSSNSIVSS